MSSVCRVFNDLAGRQCCEKFEGSFCCWNFICQEKAPETLQKDESIRCKETVLQAYYSSLAGD